MLKLNFVNTSVFSSHRSGWGYVISLVRHFHSGAGPIFNDFIEKAFSWDLENFYKYDNIHKIPYKRPWIGVLHNPPNMPIWFDYYNSPQVIINREIFQESMRFCLGIIVLSEYLQQWLSPKVECPVINLIHPTETPRIKWSVKKYLESKNVVQLGYWLRDFSTITTVPRQYNKIWLPGDQKQGPKMAWFQSQLNAIHTFEKEKIWKDVNVSHHLNNDEYDELLSGSVVILNLFDSSANNAIIECITRNTPIIVNKIPAVVEYLGEDYPLYCDFTKEQLSECLNTNNIYKAHKYLINYDKYKFSGTSFVKEFSRKVNNLIV